MRLFLSLALACVFSSASHADNVSESAKCAATFRLLTSIGFVDDGLGQYFARQGMMSSDMVAFYARTERGVSLSNIELVNIISEFQLSIDRSGHQGAPFEPIVKNCMGWTYALGQHLVISQQNQVALEKALEQSPRPTGTYSYPFDDWPQMRQIFMTAYGIWTENGKPTPKDMGDALRDALQ